MICYTQEGSETLSQAAKAAISAATRLGQTIALVAHNGMKVAVHPTDKPKIVVERYWSNIRGATVITWP
jgi:hypothetical protein